MKAPHISTRTALSRRHFLRGTGAAALSLPLLDAMIPAFLHASPKPKPSAPKRFVALCASLGFHQPFFVPTETGRNYTLTPYLNQLKEHREDFTIFSGLSHPEQQGNNGHASELTWLTSAKHPGLAGFKNTISLDQLIATEIGIQTRYPYLALSTGGSSLSWTSNGVAIPAQSRPSHLFRSLFVAGTEQEIAFEIRDLKRGRSILDTVLVDAKRLQGDLNPADKDKLNEYLQSVRDLERRLQQSEGWVKKPKPKVDIPEPKDISDRNDAIGRQKLLYDMVALALQTDSTRTITVRLGGLSSPPIIPGVKSDWHALSHHGKDENKIEELKLIEAAEFTVLNDFLTKLKSIKEEGADLLQHTAVLFGSNLGNASSHDWHNLPLLLAGGGYNHGSHIAHDRKSNTPFANLFVPLAQRMGLQIDQFGSSTHPGIKELS